MRRDSVHRLMATAKKIQLSKEDIKNNFVLLLNRREIRKCVVNRLLRLLEKGDHFETPIMVNTVNNKSRLLDGNHRAEAIQRYLEKYPERKVEVWMFEYNNLNPDEEREMYTKWNMGTKQNTNDFVQQYWNSIGLNKLFARDFPCNVTANWSCNSIEFKTLLSGYMGSITPGFGGGYQGSAIEFIDRCKLMNGKDHKVMREFMKEYIQIYGEPDKKNLHYKQGVYFAIFRIWRDNLDKPIDQMRTALLRVRGHERIVYYSTLGGTREMTIQCRKDLLNVINGKRTKNLFI